MNSHSLQQTDLEIFKGATNYGQYSVCIGTVHIGTHNLCLSAKLTHNLCLSAKLEYIPVVVLMATSRQCTIGRQGVIYILAGYYSRQGVFIQALPKTNTCSLKCKLACSVTFYISHPASHHHSPVLPNWLPSCHSRHPPACPPSRPSTCLLPTYRPRLPAATGPCPLCPRSS